MNGKYNCICNINLNKFLNIFTHFKTKQCQCFMEPHPRIFNTVGSEGSILSIILFSQSSINP